MAVKEFRTYHRRSVTRRSGYHVSGLRTGGECIILKSTKYTTTQPSTIFEFYKSGDTFYELFERNIGLLAFGGYVMPNNIAKINCMLSYEHRDDYIENEKIYSHELEADIWNSIGFHKEFALSNESDYEIEDISVRMEIIAPIGTEISFIGFDFGAINSTYYQSTGENASAEEKKTVEDFWTFFNQKTSLCIPHIYYFDATLPFETYLVDNGEDFEDGIPVILKGCNRCSRYLPINIENELRTASYVLHCKKKAPCTHSTFCRYRIDNYDELSQDIIDYYKKLGVYIYYEGQHMIKSYYGHQLECKPCKKFFVNAKLNPMRDTQQHREDSLRRRAIETLVDNLLDMDFIHFEFRKKQKKEFTDYIWKKFDCRCFKCQNKITKQEMALDHTMPLAYLYRLDETATCLCSTHNSQKSDHFPVDYYSEDELIRLSKITGLSLDVLHSREANSVVVERLKENVVWFFDDFLSQPDYQKIHDGKLEADKIYAAVVRVIDKKINLLDDYYKQKGCYPNTITIR